MTDEEPKAPKDSKNLDEEKRERTAEGYKDEMIQLGCAKKKEPREPLLQK